MLSFAATSTNTRNIYHSIYQARKEPAYGVGAANARQTSSSTPPARCVPKYRTAVQNVEKAVLAGDKTKATELFAKMQSVVDGQRCRCRGIFPTRTKAAREQRPPVTQRSRTLAWRCLSLFTHSTRSPGSPAAAV